jgi:hypothetical protein
LLAYCRILAIHVVPPLPTRQALCRRVSLSHSVLTSFCAFVCICVCVFAPLAFSA